VPFWVFLSNRKQHNFRFLSKLNKLLNKIGGSLRASDVEVVTRFLPTGFLAGFGYKAYQWSGFGDWGTKLVVGLAGTYLDAVFLGRTHFCSTNLEIWSFFGQETYIHFVAQETRIIRKLFIFNFFDQKRSKSTIQKLYFGIS